MFVVVTLVRAAIGAFATGSRVQVGWRWKLLGCTMHATCKVRELGMPCRRLLELRHPACLCREGRGGERNEREAKGTKEGRQAGRQAEGGEVGRLRHRRCSCCNAITPAYSLLPYSLDAAFTNFHHSPAFPCLYKAPRPLTLPTYTPTYSNWVPPRSLLALYYIAPLYFHVVNHISNLAPSITSPLTYDNIVFFINSSRRELTMILLLLCIISSSYSK